MSFSMCWSDRVTRSSGRTRLQSINRHVANCAWILLTSPTKSIFLPLFFHKWRNSNGANLQNVNYTSSWCMTHCRLLAGLHERLPHLFPVSQCGLTGQRCKRHKIIGGKRMKLHPSRTTYLTDLAVQMATCLALTLALTARGHISLSNNVLCVRSHAKQKKCDEQNGGRWIFNGMGTFIHKGATNATFHHSSASHS